ncbi:alanine--tRNA ligase [Sandaracinus amylolyticus]|uniref:alanine--tRNA ligase n=1 Tax=Sandaracinus amylolyticus TaxID=927083 RepID=UPI001F00BADA|nr:alanine--tRNA ligase [Sandaracinus amylolyticus]UJR79557.1 Alanyl-tRNA synthetase [Sandaracinus amylolyticus]
MKTSREIREAFLRHFEERGHTRLPSGPLVPPNDPTLYFANAGMVQFKDVFTGKDQRPYKRATTSQKCMRVKGKHNDLDNVGVTARHHTFFEMLGNFSFGDYFKRDAIKWAWEFVVGTCALPKEKLVVTVFEGEPGLPADDEAAQIWAEVTGFGPERIIRLGKADNFWSMGETGPCGPCTEIHFWMGAGEPDLAKFGQEPGEDGAGWVEIWNNVFMQFERFEDGTLTPLPAQSVDTGMGLERITAAVQGVVSNYDTDLLRPLVELASQISGKPYGGTMSRDDVAMRVIADHARATAFCIAEGVFPDKAGRESVLRSIMRRAIRFGHMLGIERLFLHEVALRVVDLMGEQYPELRERRDAIADVTQNEERGFRQTLKRGLELLHEETDGKATLGGAAAFRLHDTFGFPLDLQQQIGREQGFTVDEDGYKAEREEARDRSRGGGGPIRSGEGVAAVHYAIAQRVGATQFTGYERERDTSTITALVAGGAEVQVLREGDEGEIVTKSTPFYGESGGQVGDRGVIRAGDATFEVRDTQKPVEGLFVHQGKLTKGTLEVGAKVELEVDHTRRSATRRNHSATHLLHYALRTVLGPAALQKGSLVSPDRLRFDYSGSRPLTLDEVQRIEDLVNEKVLLNAPIETEVLPMAEAKAKGAIGIFEEKYGEVVRMLRMTSDSIELCGGTHASRTGDIGLFKIVSEGGVAAGVRRIEAVTGRGALTWARGLERDLGETAALLKGTPSQAKEKVEKLLATQKELQREIERLQHKLVSGGAGGGDLTAQAREQAGVKVLGATVDLGDAKALRELADQLRDKLAPAVVLLGSATKDGKAILACSVSKDVTSRFKAGDIVKDAAAVVGGGGGGRPDFAQAGGTDPSKLGDAVQRVYALVV